MINYVRRARDRDLHPVHLAEEPVGFEAICDANPAINDGFEIADMMSDGLMIDAMLLHESMSA